MYNFNAVLVCDRSYDRDNVNIWSHDLEYTSTKYFKEIYSSLKELCPNVYVYTEIEDFESNISRHKDDVVFAAIWSGKYSRNRKALVAAICEAQQIRYVGADAYAEILCQDKHLSELYCREFEIKVPNSIVLSRVDDVVKLGYLNFPVIIKPSLEGGSMGISDHNICYTKEEVVKKFEYLSTKYLPLLVEEYIQGEEIAACIIGTPSHILRCEFVRLEINDKRYLTDEVWGFESRKCNRSKITRKVITNEVSLENRERILTLYKSLGKVDYMRIDCRLNDDGNFYLIELTPDCSLHPDCFMYESFRHYGLTYTDMVETLLETVKDNYPNFKSTSQ